MPASTEETLSYLMIVLKHTNMPKPDWPSIAAEGGISRADNAQTKFRRMIKDIGFDYVKDQFVDPNAGAQPAATAVAKPTTPRKRKSPTKKEKADGGSESPSKKTKTEGSAGGEGEGVANGKSPSKKAKVSQSEAIKEEADIESQIQGAAEGEV
ncbi:hypothetical protein H2200_009378 [Cladophialophora chaetospira]|uniref:Myb-like DNA-binding domain-containing protein n=1 Tax=Cladophialophora chaetospira TaxID=386627 RepID=A0AA38X415_9EURO|nr:hypothetical protein H2200_009378 [Cladophialophora chaetospira]